MPRDLARDDIGCVPGAEQELADAGITRQAAEEIIDMLIQALRAPHN